MSYTLRGRLESRFAATLGPLLVACLWAALARTWWPLELAALMIAVGVLVDAAILHRLLPYQPGWAALPLGLAELAAIMLLVGRFEVEAPLLPALAFFSASWLVAQLLGHALLPLARLSYAQDGGELGRSGVLVSGMVIGVLALAGATAWASQPPTVRLEAGVHRGPLVLDHSQRLVGERGAVVLGGILVTADDVTVREVTVIGGENGIEIDGAEGVVLERVRIARARLDGIHARRASLAVRDCVVDSGANAHAQGIDISFAVDLAPSSVTGCTVTGGQEGIVTHFAHVEVSGNRVSGTSLRAISLTEMSMGMASENEVTGSLGVGIFCADFSECELRDNVVYDTRPDGASGDPTRVGFGILAHSGARAELSGNRVQRSPGGVAAVLGARLERE